MPSGADTQTDRQTHTQAYRRANQSNFKKPGVRGLRLARTWFKNTLKPFTWTSISCYVNNLFLHDFHKNTIVHAPTQYSLLVSQMLPVTGLTKEYSSSQDIMNHLRRIYGKKHKKTLKLTKTQII